MEDTPPLRSGVFFNRCGGFAAIMYIACHQQAATVNQTP